jgi:hypothetical protein
MLMRGSVTPCIHQYHLQRDDLITLKLNYCSTR